MKNKSQSSKFALAAVVITLLVSLACSLIPSDVAQDDLQSTIVALEITKIYLENQPTQEPPPPIIQNDIEPSPTIDPPTEQTIPPDINFEGIQFSFDPEIASSVNSVVIPGQNIGEDFMPGDTYPTYYEFTFNQYAISDHSHSPKILVYPVEEYRAISVYAQDQFSNFEAALINRPGGSTMSDLPFLPMWPAAQLFSAQVSYFDFQNGSGIRFLTMFGQDIYPVDNTNLFYTYQGITHDGKYYISAIMPITLTGLPDDGSEMIGDDYSEFYNNWDTYLANTMRFLGEQSLDSFIPSLRLLDEMIASILIDR